MKLIFELGTEGRGLSLMPACDVPEYTLPEERTAPLRLPHVSENELTRHYTALCKRIHGVNDGFYPLGSCTMKYNPKIDEDMAALPGFTQLHPLQPVETAQGALEALHVLGSELGEIFGMDAVTFQPAAGAHGEFTGVLLIKAYHTDRGDTARTKILVPDSAHGTNPATAAMCGYQVVNIPSGAVGCKDFLRKYMPGPLVVEKDGRFAFDYPEKSIGRVKLFYGNFDVCVKALTYVLTLGRTGIPEAAMNAVLNANYMRVKLAEKFTMAYDEICMHEFVMSLVDLHKETGVSALDLAKGMLDYGLHPPTMYFPLIVHEALMVEPCETESKETMDEVCDIYGRLFDLAYSDPDALHTAPHDTPVRRLDEVGAARNMILRYSFAQ